MVACSRAMPFSTKPEASFPQHRSNRIDQCSLRLIRDNVRFDSYTACGDALGSQVELFFRSALLSCAIRRAGLQPRQSLSSHIYVIPPLVFRFTLGFPLRWTYPSMSHRSVSYPFFAINCFIVVTAALIFSRMPAAVVFPSRSTEGPLAAAERQNDGEPI